MLCDRSGWFRECSFFGSGKGMSLTISNDRQRRRVMVGLHGRRFIDTRWAGLSTTPSRLGIALLCRRDHVAALDDNVTPSVVRLP